jgi:hypothetical protein
MILGICGLISSGKDTIADYLTTSYGFKRVSFAASLKDAVSMVFGWDRELLEGTTKSSREWREKKDEWWSNRLGVEITPRWVLQYWGTDILRKHFHTDIWVASAENKLRQSTDNIVITDCRFANEINAVKNAGGITLRVERGPSPDWYEYAENYNKGEYHNMMWSISKEYLRRNGVHASEYSSVGLKYDHLIDNNKSIDDLHRTIDSIINL